MIVKPTTSFLKYDTDAELAADAQAIIQSMTENAAIYPAPNPALPVVAAALATFSAAVAAAADGGKSLTLAKNMARAQLVALLRQLASYVQSACNGRLENLLLSGFPTQKPVRSPIGQLPAPSNLQTVLGVRSGEMDATIDPLTGAASYTWRVMPQGSDTPVLVVQTTAASATFPGLTPGTVYVVTANAVGTAGASAWSQPVMQMVI